MPLAVTSDRIQSSRILATAPAVLAHLESVNLVHEPKCACIVQKQGWSVSRKLESLTEAVRRNCVKTASGDIIVHPVVSLSADLLDHKDHKSPVVRDLLKMQDVPDPAAFALDELSQVSFEEAQQRAKKLMARTAKAATYEALRKDERNYTEGGTLFYTALDAQYEATYNHVPANDLAAVQKHGKRLLKLSRLEDAPAVLNEIYRYLNDCPTAKGNETLAVAAARVTVECLNSMERSPVLEAGMEDISPVTALNHLCNAIACKILVTAKISHLHLHKSDQHKNLRIPGLFTQVVPSVCVLSAAENSKILHLIEYLACAAVNQNLLDGTAISPVIANAKWIHAEITKQLSKSFAKKPAADIFMDATMKKKFGIAELPPLEHVCLRNALFARSYNKE